MTNKKKPLHAYEQSMLLSALLFDSSNINEILGLFPDEQRERMELAKNKFLNLPKNERLTQIVLELRRLILIEDSPFQWIHTSWIEDALDNEPHYVRELITQSMEKEGEANRENKHKKHFIPRSFIFSSFIQKLSKSPQKLAIFDPVLMRLQSLKNESQEEIFSSIGRFGIIALLETLDKNRLHGYLQRKGVHLEIPALFRVETNPLKIPSIRTHFLKEIIAYQSGDEVSFHVFSGLAITAMYLSIFKYQWRRSISLVLYKKLGERLDVLIQHAKILNLDRSQHAALSSFLLLSL